MILKHLSPPTKGEKITSGSRFFRIFRFAKTSSYLRIVALFDFCPSPPIVRRPLMRCSLGNDAISRKACLANASERLGPSSRHVSVAAKMPERKHHSAAHLPHNYWNIFRRASTSRYPLPPEIKHQANGTVLETIWKTFIIETSYAKRPKLSRASARKSRSH